MKTCFKCSQSKDDSAFRKRTNGKPQAYCLDCEKTYMSDHRKKPEIKAKERVYKHQRYESHKEEVAVKGRQRYLANKPKLLEQHKEWKRKNKERYLELSRIEYQRRRSLKKQLESNFDKYDWQRCKDSFDNHCAYCGKDSKLTQEHFIALKHGGEFTRNNILPVCGSCNHTKQSQNFFIWYPQQPFYSKQREKSILKYLQYDPQTLGQQLRLVI